MSIKYEIQSIKNVPGTNNKHNFARIFEHVPMTAKQLKSHIQASCSLTEGDIKATLSALREEIIRELSQGNRFYLPSIGYLSLSVDLNMPEDKPIDKVRGNNLRVRNIKFRPEASLLQEVRQNVRFERASFSSLSNVYTEEEVLNKIRKYFSSHSYINRRNMELLFGFRQTTALNWLKHLTETGVLKKEGVKNAPIYFLNHED